VRSRFGAAMGISATLSSVKLALLVRIAIAQFQPAAAGSAHGKTRKIRKGVRNKRNAQTRQSAADWTRKAMPNTTTVDAARQDANTASSAAASGPEWGISRRTPAPTAIPADTAEARPKIQGGRGMI